MFRSESELVHLTQALYTIDLPFRQFKSLLFSVRHYFFSFYLFHFQQGLCPEWVDWDPQNKLQNTTEAMTLADDHLGVAQVRDKTCHSLYLHT